MMGLNKATRSKSTNDMVSIIFAFFMFISSVELKSKNFYFLVMSYRYRNRNDYQPYFDSYFSLHFSYFGKNFLIEKIIVKNSLLFIFLHWHALELIMPIVINIYFSFIWDLPQTFFEQPTHHFTIFSSTSSLNNESRCKKCFEQVKCSRESEL